MNMGTLGIILGIVLGIWGCAQLIRLGQDMRAYAKYSRKFRAVSDSTWNRLRVLSRQRYANIQVTDANFRADLLAAIGKGRPQSQNGGSVVQSGYADCLQNQLPKTHTGTLETNLHKR